MKKILIVDSLMTVIDPDQSLLGRSGHTVLTAVTADQALEIHRTEKADVIITDLHTPGMSTEEFCRVVRNDETLRQVSILLVCRNTTADIDRVMRCNVNDYITKPLDKAVLLSKISQWLNISSRKSCRILLKISVEGKNVTGPFFCTSQNISATGILIRTEKVLRSGEHVTCSFFLPGSERIVTDSEVVRVIQNQDGTFQYGIKFLNLSHTSRAAIEDFIDNRAGKD
ncbi:MAG: PilZ domain-containing protein [Thermodesulfovibrionales bacterium]